jgi:hypothetical protein
MSVTIQRVQVFWDIPSPAFRSQHGNSCYYKITDVVR